MDFQRALKTAQEWGRNSGNGLHRFAIHQVVEDDVHLFMLIMEIISEKAWLIGTLNGCEEVDFDGTKYTTQDLRDFDNLLKVITNIGPGMKVG
jgi:hypothetical protein